jgi:hypothetical protein
MDGARASECGSMHPAEGLSRSAQRAKWVDSSSEHEDHRGQILITRSHEVIRVWAEAREAAPAVVDGLRWKSDRPLRFMFPGIPTPGLYRLEWDDWLRSFDQHGFAFLFQERMKDGKRSDFFRIDGPRTKQAIPPVDFALG